MSNFKTEEMETTGIEPVSSRCKLPIFPLNYVLQSGGRFELPFKILQISTLPLCYPNFKIKHKIEIYIQIINNILELES